MYSIENLRKRCDELLEQAIQEKNSFRIQWLQEAKEMLAEDDCFQKRDDRAIFFLVSRLKFKAAEAWDIVQYHNPIPVYIGRLTAHLPDQKITTPEVILVPSMEDYGYFVGRCFYKTKGDNYYSLWNDDHWHYDPELERWWDRDTAPVSMELIREITGEYNPRR